MIKDGIVLEMHEEILARGREGWGWGVVSQSNKKLH